MISDKNYREATPELDLEYERCVFAFLTPVDTNGVKTGHRLFAGDDTPRTFTNCNMVNCEPPPGSTLIKCNTTIVTTGVVGSSDTINIGGDSHVVEHLENRIHGRLNPDTLEYEYNQTDIVVAN